MDSRDESMERAAAMAYLERRDYVLWLMGPDRWAVTSYAVKDEARQGFAGRVDQSGKWSFPVAIEVARAPQPKGGPA